MVLISESATNMFCVGLPSFKDEFWFACGLEIAESLNFNHVVSYNITSTACCRSSIFLETQQMHRPEPRRYADGPELLSFALLRISGRCKN